MTQSAVVQHIDRRAATLSHGPAFGQMGRANEPGGPRSVPSCPYRSDGADPALLKDLAQDTDGIERAGESRVRDGLDDRLDHLPR
jgi:hypothetical protein